ncbi:MAG: TatD family hydrolase [Candidatus Nanoperiomorbaceae bacterium]
MLIDTHTHIHESDFPLRSDVEIKGVLRRAAQEGVKRMMLVGTSLRSSEEAELFIKKWRDFATKLGIKFVMAAGIHPHFADPELKIDLIKEVKKLDNFIARVIRKNDVHLASIGEIGLDFFYDFSFRKRQIELFKLQLELARKFSLPINFHIRDFKKPAGENSVWLDFWNVMRDQRFADFGYKIPLMFHSYTEQSRDNLAKILSLQNVHFGVNGISTFAKIKEQDLWRDIPLNKMVLETDAPFLAPSGFRGQTNEPARVMEIAQNLAKLRNVSLTQIEQVTTTNAEHILNFWR